MLQELFHNIRDIVLGPHLDERRSVPRVLCDIKISCQNKARTVLLNGTLRDLSFKGAQLKVHKKVEKGEILGILPPDSVSDAGPERIVGRVAWIRSFRQHYLIGLRFSKLPEKSWVERFLRELGLQSSAPRQRRQLVRFPTNLKLRCENQAEQFPATLKDLSLGGMLLETSRTVREKEKFRVTLPKLSGAPSLQLAVTCRKCVSESGVQRYSVRAQFDNLNEQDKKGLVKHLKVLLKESLKR